MDLSTISRETVRDRLITIPQDFILLNEPIRLALDPDSQHSDEAVIEALSKARVWELVQRKDGLQTMGYELVISHGERQLFALARAMLSRGRIVLLDEACSRFVSPDFLFSDPPSFTIINPSSICC